MALFLTGATGYIGAHVAANLLSDSQETLLLLVRAKDPDDAARRLWRSLQLHMDFPRFSDFLADRLQIFRGDITTPHFGLDEADYARLVHSTDSVIHCAASLNRKSEKSCLNVNLRGTLEVLQLARRSREHHGLRRFSHVSTVAVAGQRSHEVIAEDASIEWDRSDFDPYARTKKFTELMVRELLDGTPLTIFRPSIVLGDSRRPQTNQFEMVRAFAFLAALPVLPFRSKDKIDIVPVDYVAAAIALLHQKERTNYDCYHLSSGRDSETFQQVTAALAAPQGKHGPIYLPGLEPAACGLVNRLAGRKGNLGTLATLMKVFLPYLTWDTVFDNARVAAEVGRAPVPFSQYCCGLLAFSRKTHFSYPFEDWPAGAAALGSAGDSRA